MTPGLMGEPASVAGLKVARRQTDGRLVELVRAGSVMAFEVIVERYRAELMRYSCSLLPPAPAEDVVQQTFINAYDALRADEREIRLRPWLYRIARNLSLNALRRHDWDAPQLLELRSPDDVHETVETRLRLDAAVEAVQALPPRQRSAVVLRELEGRSYAQIADHMSLSGGAVRQLLSRARETLRTAAGALAPPALVMRIAGRLMQTASTPEIVAQAGSQVGFARAGAAAIIASAALASTIGAGNYAVSHLGHRSWPSARARVADVAGSVAHSVYTNGAPARATALSSNRAVSALDLTPTRAGSLRPRSVTGVVRLPIQAPRLSGAIPGVDPQITSRTWPASPTPVPVVPAPAGFTGAPAAPGVTAQSSPTTVSVGTSTGDGQRQRSSGDTPDQPGGQGYPTHDGAVTDPGTTTSPRAGQPQPGTPAAAGDQPAGATQGLPTPRDGKPGRTGDGSAEPSPSQTPSPSPSPSSPSSSAPAQPAKPPSGAGDQSSGDARGQWPGHPDDS